MASRARGGGGGGGAVDVLRERLVAELLDQRLSPHTIRKRLNMFDRLGDPRTATKADVLRIVADVDQGSRQAYLSCIRALYSDLAALGACEMDPTVGVRRGRPKQYEPRPITEELLQAILAIGGRTREWAILGAYAGLRGFEVLQVQADHLLDDRRGQTLLIPRGKGGKRATIPAHPLVVEVLRSHEPGRVIWPMSTAGLQKAWKVELARHGLACGFHQLRHRFATAVYQSTGDLLTTAKVCRHASMETTMVYAAVADRRPYEAVLAI